MNAAVTRWHVSGRRPVEYDIVCSRHLFHPQNEVLLSVGRIRGGRRLVVVDSNVARHCLGEIRSYFAYHSVDARIVLFPGGEENKTLTRYLDLVNELDAFPIHRRDEPIIAIGGGVLTDVVGFVASSYRRGVPHIKVPTTLMAYVDAAVGVKASINFNGHKNRLGSFEAPQRVFLDRTFLRTLSRRHVLNGVCEIIKLAVIKDSDLFDELERCGAESVAANFQNPAGGGILERAVGGMLEELEPNLFEDELARKVDFGHSFSYGLETCAGTDLLHGEAVLLDILVSSRIAAARQLLSQAELERIFRLLERLGITVDTGALDTELLWQSLLERIEHRNGLQRVPVPSALGQCTFLNDITRTEIDTAIRWLNARLDQNMNPAPNVDAREIGKFDQVSQAWWDTRGEMRMLHVINPLRCNFICSQIDAPQPKILDVGCGGGILSEALARSGARVTAIDLSQPTLVAAREHARSQGLEIDYRYQHAEQLAREEAGNYDAVTCMEMLEHVPDPAGVIAACARALKPGGYAFFSTINRSLKAFLFAIVAGEYLLHLLPRGTHRYKKLIRPRELRRWALDNGLEYVSVASLMYNPLTGNFKVAAGKADVNYMVCFSKRR